MQQDRWNRIESVCAEAIERTGPERVAWVQAECAGDPALEADVLSLLAELESDPGFLEQPLITRPETEGTLEEGSQVGPYVVARLLGRGGMGEVYLATRDLDGAVQRVALKVIRAGMASDEVVRRFRLERRIMAQLNHPSVAQLIDAGVGPDSRPYFVMEFVEGEPLTSWCDDRQLSVAARLRLFQGICAAVQHAHQRLVLHRDLKPRNILVTADGVPKLLDFGIGKVMDDRGSTDATTEGVRRLTPAYAAPEQLAGAPVTTATDVYALGVMLYELLTGVLPFDHHAAESPTGRLTMPARPSTHTPSVAGARARAATPDVLRRTLAGDLDTIVLMALRPEPERRYASAAALSDDLTRYLEGQPVSARPDTLRYRVRKFVSRNTGSVVAAATVLVALVAVTGISVVQSRRVTAAAARTAEERDKALEVRGFLMEMFGATGADQAVGDTVSVRALLDRQRAQLDQAFSGREIVKADMLDVLADGYDRLGLYADAEPLARRALDLRQELLPVGHPDLATSRNLLGWIIHERGRSIEAEPLLLDAIAQRRADPGQREALSRSLNDLGVVYNALQRYPDAERVLREALAIRRAAYGDAHRSVGITANNLAAALYFQRQLDSAQVVQSLALKALQSSVGPDHQRTVVALNNLAAFRRAGGDLAGAESSYRELATRQARLQGRDHPVTARVLLSLAIVVADRGRTERSDPLLAEAEGLYREATAVFERRLGPDHPQVGQTLDRLAGVLLLRGRTGEAVSTSIRALTVLRRRAADTSRDVRAAAERLAASHRAAGDTAAAQQVERRFPPLTKAR